MFSDNCPICLWNQQYIDPPTYMPPPVELVHDASGNITRVNPFVEVNRPQPNQQQGTVFQEVVPSTLHAVFQGATQEKGTVFGKPVESVKSKKPNILSMLLSLKSQPRKTVPVMLKGPLPHPYQEATPGQVKTSRQGNLLAGLQHIADTGSLLGTQMLPPEPPQPTVLVSPKKTIHKKPSLLDGLKKRHSKSHLKTKDHPDFSELHSSPEPSPMARPLTRLPNLLLVNVLGGRDPFTTPDDQRTVVNLEDPAVLQGRDAVLRDVFNTLDADLCRWLATSDRGFSVLYNAGLTVNTQQSTEDFEKLLCFSRDPKVKFLITLASLYAYYAQNTTLLDTKRQHFDTLSQNLTGQPFSWELFTQSLPCDIDDPMFQFFFRTYINILT